MSLSSDPEGASHNPSIDDCWWYHSIDLPNFGTVEGQWDLRGRFSDYIGGVDLRGHTVLDVGAASGFISMEAEKHGASKVIGFDAENASQYQFMPHVAPPIRRCLPRCETVIGSHTTLSNPKQSLF
jgi:hypothetical protein